MSPPPRRHTPETCARRARSPTGSQRPPPRGARAVAMATPRLAGPVAVLSREGRPPEVGGDPEVAAPQSWSVRSTPPEDPVRLPLRGLPLRDWPWTVRGCHPSGRGRGSGGRPRLHPGPDPRLPGPPQRPTRPPPISGACERRGHLWLWSVRSQRTGKGNSCTAAPEPRPGRWVRARPPRGRSQAGGDALTVRVGAGGAEPVQARQPCPHRSPQPCPLARSLLRAPKKRVRDEGKLPTFAGVFKG